MYNDSNDGGDENMGRDEGFRLKPEWEQGALEKDPQKMANGLYYDLKQQKHSGVIPHPDSISRMVDLVDDILYRDYHWNNDQLKMFREKINELNVIFDKNSHRMKIWGGAEWESYIEDMGAKEIISLIQVI